MNKKLTLDKTIESKNKISNPKVINKQLQKDINNFVNGNDLVKKEKLQKTL